MLLCFHWNVFKVMLLCFFIAMYLIYTTAVWLYVDMIDRSKLARDFNYMYGKT